MKERCWKQLKSQLCPPERWVKDSEHSKCQCCSKQFLLLIRRRHHCRFCGNLFCSECSDYFINGNYIGENNEKYIRHCEFCHKKIQKFIKEWTKMPQVYEQKNVQNNKEEELTEDEEDQKQLQFNLNKMFEEAEKSAGEINQVMGERMNKIMAESAEALCDKFGIDKLVWKGKIKDLAVRAINETKMEVLVSENSPETAMDIAKRVKVKSIVSEGNKGVQAMVKGIVLQKNTATKSMQTHLSNPKVLIIQNSIDLDSLASFIKFEQLIKNDKAIMKKILQKILKLNPDIIFVQNNVHVFVLQYLQSKQIVVVNKLKQKEIQMIKEVTGIKKTIKKLWMLEKYKHHCIIGKCDKIYFKTAREGQMLMFIESAEMGIRTILIGEENEDQTNNLKKSVQILMRMARQLNLEKNFILIEKQLKDGIGKKECILPTIEDFTSSIYSNIENFIINQEICFSKVLYSPIKLSQSPKNFQEYAHRVGKTSYKQMCGKVQFLTKKIYTSSDFTLGAYILMAAANFERPCKKCANNHKEQYYIEDYTVSIETEKKNSTAVTKSSSSSFIEMNDEQFTLQKLKNHLTKQKQLIMISTHASCEICGQVVGVDNVKVGKLFLSNSFHHILHSLVIAYELTVSQLHDKNIEDDNVSSYSLSQVNRKLSRRKLSIDRCEHSVLTRVYEYAGVLIKVSMEPTRPSYVDYIDLTSKQALEHIRTKQNKFLKKMYEHELSQKNKLLDKITNLLSTLPFPNSSSASSMSPNPKAMQCFDSAMKMKDILEKCRTELKEVQVKSVEELEKAKHDWTILTRRVLKVQSILLMAFLIIDELERILRKKKNEENNQNPSQNLDSSIVIESHIQNPLDIDDTADNISIITNPNAVQPETYLDEQTNQYLKKRSKKIFPRVQGTVLHFHTANINDPVSLLACGINSSQYRRICEEEANGNSTQFKFRMNGYKKLKTDWPLRAETDKIYMDVVGEINDKMEAIEITVFYPKEFEAFRKRQGIDNELYIRGLCTCRSWDSSGGKSNSMFAKAENDLLVVKVINEKEFDEFLKFAKDYINYLKNSKKVGRDTLLAKIFGIYEVAVRGKIYKCVVMQNIFFGLQSIDKVYDLKGSEVNRLNMPPQGIKSFTGQDTNFKIDKEGQPYVLRGHEYNRIISTLEQDSAFLKQNSVIDYSLLAIQSKNTLRLGIIDYMRPYQLMEKIETIYKEFKSGRDPTVIPPGSYAERFVAAMKRYFIKTQ